MECTRMVEEIYLKCDGCDVEIESLSLQQYDPEYYEKDNKHYCMVCAFIRDLISDDTFLESYEGGCCRDPMRIVIENGKIFIYNLDRPNYHVHTPSKIIELSKAQIKGFKMSDNAVDKWIKNRRVGDKQTLGRV